MKVLAGWIVVLLFSLNAMAQEEPVSLWLEEHTEELAGEESDSYNNEWEELASLREHPLNLNAVTFTQLKQIPFLTDDQIDGILEYVGLHGPIRDLSELQLIRELDFQTIRLLRPYVCIISPREELPLPRKGRHELLVRLDHPFYTRKGYAKAYLGPKQYQSIRWQYRRGERIRMGLAAEKDAGEPWGAMHNKWGYDHYAYYMQWSSAGWLEQGLAGCYRASFGQGLVLGNGFLQGKSYSLATAEYTSQGIRPFASTDENNFLHGGAVTVRPAAGWHLSAFGSYRRIDAIVKEGAITSIQQTGLHRTATEAARKDTSAMYLAGMHLNRTFLYGRMGLTAIGYGFDRPYQPSLTGYAHYRMHGRHFYNVGIDYRVNYKGMSLAGEAAKGTRGIAVLNKLSYRFLNGNRLLLIHRYYAHDYWAYFAHAFSESTSPQNENGWYLASETALTAAWRLFASADFYSFPFMKYGISKASQGMDIRGKISWTPRQSHSSAFLTYRYRQGEHDIAGTKGERITRTMHHRWRMRYTWEGNQWSLRTTADYNRYHQLTLQPSQGWQFTQMVAYTPRRFPLSCQLQGTYFHTDDYSSRVYVSEPGLLFTYYQPALSGRGFRTVLRLRVQIGTSLTLLAKWGLTCYQDREVIGTGNDQIAGRSKSDLQMQVRWKF